jgi:hypothetical protein
MRRPFHSRSRTESAATAAGASLLSVVTVGDVLAMFTSVTPDVSTTQPIMPELQIMASDTISSTRCVAQVK